MSTSTDPAAHVAALAAELRWLEAVLHARLAQHFGQPDAIDPSTVVAPVLAGTGSALAHIIIAYDLNREERLVLALAMAPHLKPQLLDPLLLRNASIDRGFTEFGGRKGRAHSGFLPTGETAVFVAAGDDLGSRLNVAALFAVTLIFHRTGLLTLVHEGGIETQLSGTLHLSDETLGLLMTNVHAKPDFSPGFPAHLITTPMAWDDLVLTAETRADVHTVLVWISHGAEMIADWGMQRVLKPGYRTLFYGPSGTGKTLTATLIGKATGKDVYRIDLSMLVSKYIGETEKNLARVIDRAETSDSILLFDEADALFSKRTMIADSHDRYANQEVAYLLQRLEEFPGLVVLATRMKDNIDEAFARRFQSMVHFPMPDVQ